jgi:hypothetical protein
MYNRINHPSVGIVGKIVIAPLLFVRFSTFCLLNKKERKNLRMKMKLNINLQSININIEKVKKKWSFGYDNNLQNIPINFFSLF